MGLFEKDILKGVTLLLEKSTPIKKSLFYAPRGFLIDYNDSNLLQEFTKEVTKYVKNKNALILRLLNS